MTFLVASFPEFLQFLKIVMWISIPLFLVSTLVVVFLHYRNKRKQSFADLPGYELQPEYEHLQSSPFFHINQKYQQRIQSGKEQFRLLEKDFRQIKQNYTSMIAGSPGSGADSSSHELHEKINQYEVRIKELQQTIEQLQHGGEIDDIKSSAETWIAEKEVEIKRLHSLIESSNREIVLLNEQNHSKDGQLQKMDQLLKELQESARQASLDARGMQLSLHEQHEDRDKQHFDENKRLNDQVKELHEQFRKMEEENTLLQQRLQQHRLEAGNNSDAEQRISDLQNALIRTEQELLLWKNKMVDAGSLEEMVEEKNKQIEFLQNQLDQKIRNGRQLEQRAFDMEGQLSNLNKEIEAGRQKQVYLQEDRQIKEEEINNLNRQIQEGITENRELKQSVLDATDKISILENDAIQFRERMGEFEAEIKRNGSLTSTLNEQIADAHRHIQMLESKLQERQQLLARLHADLSQYAELKEEQTERKDFRSYTFPQLVEQA